MSYDDLTKQVDEIKVDLGTVKYEFVEVQKKLVSIETHVTNHIMHVLQDQSNMLGSIDNRIKVIEIHNTKISGVSEMLSILLKAMTAIAAITWTGLQIYKFFVH
jgi:hypothetical protein